jgi:hypothetical protein
MRRFTLLGVAVLSVLALASIAASAAFALPTLNPATAVTFTGTGGLGKLEVLNSSLKVECKKNKNEGNFAANTVLGPFHITFEECSAKLGEVSLGTCTGLGDTAKPGTILSLGEDHIVYDTLVTLGAALLFLLEPVHFECKSITTVLFVVTGSEICLISPINTATTSIKVNCNAAEKGDALETRYWNDAGEEKKSELLVSENEKAAVDGSESAEAVLTPSHAVEVVA